jgi:hypothetical protein
MSDYKRIPTTEEVWLTIKKNHPELRVFSSYSAPQGDFYSGYTQACMQTSYGFYDNDYPIIEAKTTWTFQVDRPYERIDEIHKYWLCIPIRIGF